MEKTRLRWLWTLVLVLLFCGAGREVYGQRVYGSYFNSGGVKGSGGNAGLGGSRGADGSFQFQDVANIGDSDYSNSSNIEAISGQPGTGALGLLAGEGGSTSAWIELSFSKSTIASQLIYINAIIYDQFRSNKVSVQAYNYFNSTYTSVGTAQQFNDLPKTSNGEVIFSVNGSFNRLRIIIETDKGSSLLGLLGGASYLRMRLYYAYFLDSECHAAINTSFGASGLTIDLIGEGAKVVNPYNAIDDDLNTHSKLLLGSGVTIGLGSFVYQDVLFKPSSLQGNGVRLYLRSPQSVVNLNLFSGVKITVYNGASMVFEKTLDQILGLDLLGLLGGQQLVPVDIYGVNSSFDKVRISLGNFLNIGVLSGGMEFNMIQMLPPLPEVNSSTANACKGDLLALEVKNPNSSLVYKWYLNGNNIGTGNQLQYSTNSLITNGSPYEFVVRSIAPNCISQESGGSIIRVMVYDKPGKAQLTISDVIN
ncbi:hypothetical protein SAMN05660841_03762 [Sphingobacterium nematocida]|uniref:Uncharacterized protein n=1 Tax=Sphingobacterium nematocida TaxID=1513896 RepID=A0A1T5G4K6_9SPHI|nr:hypothetical protein [Sphingobacterium nematocida]SKC03370.1 hypothetical protein SAMN05660841_03762 [Sphingobacterium nematocida]